MYSMASRLPYVRTSARLPHCTRPAPTAAATAAAANLALRRPTVSVCHFAAPRLPTPPQGSCIS